MLAVLAGAAISSCRPAVDPAPPGPELRIALRIQPQNARVGEPIGTAPVLEVVDRDNQLVTRPAMVIRATVHTGTGQVGGGAEVAVVGGLATFSDLVLLGPSDGRVELGFQLFEDGIANPEAVAFADTLRLITGAPASLATQPPAAVTGTPGLVVSPPPSVIVRDASGNPVAGATVTFSIAAGEGRLSGAAESVTNAEGVTAVSGWVLGLPGTNQLRATTPTPSGTQPSQEVTFSAAVTSTAGMLRIRLAGSPAGALHRVRVLKTSAQGVIHDVTYDVRDSLTVTGLPFGTYQVQGQSLEVGTRIWLPDGTLSGLNVATTAAPSVSLNYREHGRFEITTRGLPTPSQTGVVDFLPTAGALAAAFNVTVLNDAITRSLGPLGTYDVVPRVVGVGGQQYAASPARQSVVLLGGDNVAQLSLDYAITTGTLTVTLAGTLPAGAAPQIDVTGPGGFHETVLMSTSPRTWTGLAPGTYTIVASPITVTGTLFRPTPVTSMAIVTAGNTTPVTITYNP